MKALLSFAALLTASTAAAQITLEHTYENSGVYSGSPQSQLYVWNFEASGTKYVDVDRVNKTITLYHLDHTFYKEISFASAPTTLGISYIMYLSEHLFDLD